MNEVLAYQFDDSPVRVVMIADDPWFVANDVSIVLGYKQSAFMTRNLDDDEKGLHIVQTLGGNQEMNIISESGLYAAVLKSRRPEARRFRKWVTAEVLPAIRRTGRYQLHDHAPPPPVPLDLDPTRLTAGVSVVREARRLFGPNAARNLWMQVGLPPCVADSEAVFEGDPFAAPLKNWLADRHECTIQQAAEGIGLSDIDNAARYRVGRLLRMFGWQSRKRKVALGKTANVFTRPAPLTAEIDQPSSSEAVGRYGFEGDEA